MPTYPSKRTGLSRRIFLGSSVTAALGSIAHSAASQIKERAEPFHPVEVQALQDAGAFRSAMPIWPQGREKEMNLFVGFRAEFQAPENRRVYLRVAGSTLYRIYLNGAFLAFGPARGPHGYFRIDAWDMTPLLMTGNNLICIEVAGYNVNSYYVLDQASFLQAEVATDETVLASTGGDGAKFAAKVLAERLQKVQRYSFQRSFSEVYRLDPAGADWREHNGAAFPADACESFGPRRVLPRRVPYPDYRMRQPQQVAAKGKVRWGRKGPATLAEDRSVPFGAKISPKLKGYREDEMATIPYLELQKMEPVENTRVNEAYENEQPIRLEKNEFRILDFGTNLTGFFGASVEARNPTKLYFLFDETLTDGDVDFTRLMCVNIVAYTLAAGSYKLECFEPYVLRFLKLVVTEGECEVRDIYLREYTAPDVWTADFISSDRGLNQLFTAGRETYRANAVDIFTDTPSRERAGWLCDSSFTAQVSPLLSGHTKIEKCYFENYLLPEKFSNIPDGMVPMCYPAEHYDGGFVPNWALWFLVQLEQYQRRSGDREMVQALRPRVEKLLKYFETFRNDNGLLEKLAGWVFVEWSKSNDYVQDVNYPTNMLYAGALAAAGRTFGIQRLVEDADTLRRAIVAQSYDGEFFVDNALRKDGKLSVTHNRSETCQYYAFYFETASFQKYPKLWETLRTQFGPPRFTSGAFPEIAPSNAFMGNVMRLELLSRAGLTDQLASEAKTFYQPMAELTGTFWENMGNEASMNHAFGSHLIVHLFRDMLGLFQVDAVRKSVHLRFNPSSLQWCEGQVPTRDGFVSLRWAKDGEKLVYELDVPAGYSVSEENRTSSPVLRKTFPHGKVKFGYRIEGGYK